MKWLLYLPIHLLAMSIRWPLAWVAVRYFLEPSRLHLKPILRLFDTCDNDLSGDDGWKREHLIPGSHPLFELNIINWLRRNGWNTLNYQVIGVPYDKWWSFKRWMIQDSKNFWLRDDGAWQWRLSLNIPFTKRVWTPYVGWGLFGPKHGRCKFTCTILRFNKV